MKKIISILVIFSVLVGSASVYAMGSPQSTNPNGPNYVGPKVAAAAKPTFPKMFYIPKTGRAGSDFNIEKVPSYILDDQALVFFLEEISLSLISFGFVYNLFLNLYRTVTGQEAQNKSFSQLFAQFVWALALLGAWEYGLLFTQYLSVVDSVQIYIVNNLTIGSITNGILTTIKEMISQVNFKGGGFEWYNPFSWAKLGQLVLAEVALRIYGVFPIFVGINLGEYSAKLSPLFNWFKWFFEVSTWGVVILLENVFFNLIVGNYLASAGLIAPGMGFSLVVAIGLIVVMVIMLIVGPFLVHKIFGLTSGHEVRGKARPSAETRGQIAKAAKVAKAILTGGASIPADAAAEAAKKAAGSTAENAQNAGAGGGSEVKPGERAGGAVAPGVFQQPNTNNKPAKKE